VPNLPFGPHSPTLWGKAEESPIKAFSPSQFNETKAFNTQIAKYGTNNHFELGQDPNGGFNNLDKSPKIVTTTDRNGNAFEREMYREKGNKQNFSI
jgi:hypothetical protein